MDIVEVPLTTHLMEVYKVYDVDQTHHIIDILGELIVDVYFNCISEVEFWEIVDKQLDYNYLDEQYIAKDMDLELLKLFGRELLWALKCQNQQHRPTLAYQHFTFKPYSLLLYYY